MLLALPEATKAVKRKLEPLFDMDTAVAELSLLHSPILRDEIAEAGLEAMLMVAPDQGFDITDQTIATFLNARTTLVSTAINKETDKQLRAELVEGIAAGETIEELAARIETVYGAAAGHRAERIARTETIRAENFATQEAWRQSGVVSAKEWYTAQDERVCEFCRPMNGKIVGLTAKFFEKGDTFTGDDGKVLKIDFDHIYGAPLHANCRCTLLPVLVSD